MSKVSKIVKSVSSILGFGKPKTPELPTPAVPAPPAPNAITDTGADVALGGDGDVKNQRVSGRSIKRSGTGADPLGGLGKSGLNI